MSWLDRLKEAVGEYDVRGALHRGRVGIAAAGLLLVAVVVVAIARRNPEAGGVEPGTELAGALAPVAERPRTAPQAEAPEAANEPAAAPEEASARIPRVALGAPGTTWPEVDRVAKPEAVRGIYVSSWAAGSDRKRAQLLRLADRTEVNAFVVDVKDVTGYVSYWTTVPTAHEVGAHEQVRIGDIRGVMRELRERGVYPIARIVVFKDPLLAEARPEWAIQTKDGEVWRDQQGYAWVDPYNREVWDYAIALAREAAALGFSEVQWDYVRFPDVPYRLMKDAVFPAREGRTKAQAIREFMQYSKEKLADVDVPVTADVFGVTVSAAGDVGIGQEWEMMSDVIDVLLPMVYPSHYPRGSYGIGHPNARPYETIKTAMEHAVRRSKGIEGAASVRPWLQDFTLGEPSYGPAHVRAQIEAVYDAGLTEWILWNPSSRYTAEALAPEGGPAPYFPLPRTMEKALPDPGLDLLGKPVAAG